MPGIRFPYSFFDKARGVRPESSQCHYPLRNGVFYAVRCRHRDRSNLVPRGHQSHSTRSLQMSRLDDDWSGPPFVRVALQMRRLPSNRAKRHRRACRSLTRHKDSHGGTYVCPVVACRTTPARRWQKVLRRFLLTMGCESSSLCSSRVMSATSCSQSCATSNFARPFL